MRYRATLAYDGSEFQGFQRQIAGTPTVQNTVESALTAIARQHIPIIGAGRTDTGVHATGQVIAFDLDWQHGETALYRALNANLPKSVAVTALCETSDDFHPRFGALRRQYQYTLLLAQHHLPLQRHTAWIVLRRQLDIEAMQTAAQALIGKRDFGALGTPPQGNNTVREITRSQWELSQQPQAAQLTYTIEADAFLYRMVRRTVGMLYDVGRGRLNTTAFSEIIAKAEVAQGVTIAPPQGLVLTQVTYPGDKLE